MTQHGGAANGYMLYCDGMSSAGQVAAFSLEKELCEGQRLYFSGYVGSVGKEGSNPNFTISVQGSNDGNSWTDITKYMTGDIKQSDKWYQIFFPIEHERRFTKFRVRVYNMASDYRGNDFIIDDMCIFATKPPLIAYQANTKCVEKNESDSIVHVVFRVDYQGLIHPELYNNQNVYYTVEQITREETPVHTFVPMIDKYLNEDTVKAVPPSAVDTLYGHFRMPSADHEPSIGDSVFVNLNQLAARFEESVDSLERWEKKE